MRIRAQVVDIRSDFPTSEDAYLVDTNIWYWLGYQRASLSDNGPNDQVVQHYTDYVKRVLDTGATLYWCGISLAELAHNIEKVEREIYNANLRDGQDLTTKQYRHDCPNQRRNVLGYIEEAWAIVTAMGRPLDICINAETTASALITLRGSGLDGYDSLLVEATRGNGIAGVLTHDGDYTTVSGLTVFTCNERAIREARDNGRLIARQTNP